ncbi:MAG: DNA-3-methyladenine glycosylase family protein [Halodesulfurarchaeum sp.]
MAAGHLEAGSFPGSLDLSLTLESGQTFLWRDVGDRWYRTVDDGQVIEVRERDGGLDWRAHGDPVPSIRKRLGLDTDLPAILEAFPDDPVLQAARDRLAGLRLVNEPPVPTVFSFILSAQMRVERIHELVTALRRTYGDRIEWGEESVAQFPETRVLAETSEEALRDLGLGYRAPYVRETAKLLAAGAIDLDAVADLPYERAREALTELVGVGPKVADCVLLFGMGFSEPVPLDTWIRTAIQEHFPGAAKGSYAETSRAIRERLGPHPGYAQTYVFTHLRTREGA